MKTKAYLVPLCLLLLNTFVAFPSITFGSKVDWGKLLTKVDTVNFSGGNVLSKAFRPKFLRLPNKSFLLQRRTQTVAGFVQLDVVLYKNNSGKAMALAHHREVVKQKMSAGIQEEWGLVVNNGKNTQSYGRRFQTTEAGCQQCTLSKGRWGEWHATQENTMLDQMQALRKVVSGEDVSGIQKLGWNSSLKSKASNRFVKKLDPVIPPPASPPKIVAKKKPAPATPKPETNAAASGGGALEVAEVVAEDGWSVVTKRNKRATTASGNKRMQGFDDGWSEM